MKNLLCITVFVILMYGCHSSQPSEPSTREETLRANMDLTKTNGGVVHKLSDFHLTSALSAEELFKTIGPPTRYAGSGVTYFVYELEDERELWLRFAPQKRDGFTHLVLASLFARKNGRMEPEQILLQEDEVKRVRRLP
jgi:hypothetical protein